MGESYTKPARTFKARAGKARQQLQAQTCALVAIATGFETFQKAKDDLKAFEAGAEFPALGINAILKS